MEACMVAVVDAQWNLGYDHCCSWVDYFIPTGLFEKCLPKPKKANKHLILYTGRRVTVESQSYSPCIYESIDSLDDWVR